MSDTPNPVNAPADYSRHDYDPDNPPTFVLDARDRHALGALRDYKTRVAGDGVASASYVRMVDDALDVFVGWQAVNSSHVMSPDQPYRSAHDIDPAQRSVVEGREDPLVAGDDEPDQHNPPVGTHPGGDEGTVAPPDALDSPYVATTDPGEPQVYDPNPAYQPEGGTEVDSDQESYDPNQDQGYPAAQPQE